MEPEVEAEEEEEQQKEEEQEQEEAEWRTWKRRLQVEATKKFNTSRNL